MLIATAGHVDHGKTTLVRALTGVETDRLPEEKARGISIDLGFAYWRTEGGGTVGFVDVPGHERFIGNMLAGVGGADFALLVVAADEGPKPQTVEHLQAIDLLGIGRGAVALTRCDRAGADRIARTRAEVEALLADTVLAGAPVFPLSAPTGDGIAALAAHLSEAAGEPQPHSAGGFRMAVDRSFSVAGSGTVATGTVLAGSLEVGGTVAVSPSGLEARVRGLQSAGSAIGRATAGLRCAINLAGVAVADVGRGDWLVSPALHAPTDRIEARVRVLAGRPSPLRHGAALRLHIGTAEVPARLLTRRQAAIPPGGDELVTLALDRPVHAINGDRFVLRDLSGRMLAGGGRVVDPFPPRRRRDDATRQALAAALERHDAAGALSALVDIPGHETGADWFAQAFGLEPAEALALAAQAGAEALGRDRPVLLSSRRVADLVADVLATLANHHRDHPDEGGLTRRDLRRHLAGPPSAVTLDAVLRRLADAGHIAFSGTLAHLPGHAPAFAPAEVALWQALLASLEDKPPRIVTPAEAARELGAAEGSVRAMLYRRRIAGDLWAVTEGRFMLREQVAALAATAADLATASPAGFTAAEFRDATAIGRNHVIRLLEFFDRIGVTVRRGDARGLRADWQAVTGTAEAYRPPA